MRGISRVAPLTSIRGLAAWWVAAYHFRDYLPATPDSWIVAIAARGFYAVDLFFILSGFVLHLNYSHLFLSPNRESLHKFAAARFARVYPLHLFMMLVFLFNPLMIALFSHQGLVQSDLRFEPVFDPELGVRGSRRLECSVMVDQHRICRLYFVSNGVLFHIAP